MEVIYGLIPMMLFFGFLVVVAFIWMAKKGYFDDMDGQANRILMDDDDFTDEVNNRTTAQKESAAEVVDGKDENSVTKTEHKNDSVTEAPSKK